jgi:hypothetical protein
LLLQYLPELGDRVFFKTVAEKVNAVSDRFHIADVLDMQ